MIAVILRIQDYDKPFRYVIINILSTKKKAADL